MRSLLSVTAPAGDLSLLTITQLRRAADVTDKSQDANLKEIGERVAAAITAACRLRADGATPPTLRQESLAETFRLEQHTEALILARRPVTNLASITEAGTLLVAGTDYELDASAGMVYRLSGDVRRPWVRGRHGGQLKIMAVYDAGWAKVPADLARAAAHLAKHFLDTDGQESNVQQELSDGFGRVQYFHGPNDGAVLPASVLDLLAPYINVMI